ncbi:hypothetical protein [Acidithiobacillus ferrivorans]|uniref:hypothetical protein n=1 Tax=Acidithiobacillus ferrivorans TaxID=160808 RepID=UPI001E642CC5|nr:hypothetical protein [Acidithiobacillus ferrivorans]
MLQATVGGSQEPDRPVPNPIGLVVRARTQARRLAECHPTAIPLPFNSNGSPHDWNIS